MKNTFSPEKAMQRELLEEAGVNILEENWKLFAVMEGEEWKTNCFMVVGPVDDVKTMGEEVVGIYSVDEIRNGQHDYELIQNLPWLIPMAIVKDFEIASIGYR